MDPRAEWAEIFQEGLAQPARILLRREDARRRLEGVWAKYEPLVAFVNHRDRPRLPHRADRRRADVGHSYLTGRGDVPSDAPVIVGLLGADYAIENGHYRIKRIYTGENWNPDLRAPLSAPGHQRRGRRLPARGEWPSAHAADERVLGVRETAGHQIAIRVNGAPTTEGSRLVTVVPVASEDGLRTRAWIEDNRRKVDELSHGTLAYVWLPNTSIPGYSAFTRYFYSQQNKDGAIIDERYNHGGLVADYIVNELDRKPMGYFAMRDGKDVARRRRRGIYGPKVMLDQRVGRLGRRCPSVLLPAA